MSACAHWGRKTARAAEKAKARAVEKRRESVGSRQLALTIGPLKSTRPEGSDDIGQASGSTVR